MRCFFITKFHRQLNNKIIATMLPSQQFRFLSTQSLFSTRIGIDFRGTTPLSTSSSTTLLQKRKGIPSLTESKQA